MTPLASLPARRLCAAMFLLAAAACGGAARMPKGPPPEYEEYDAGRPIFEGEGAEAAPLDATETAPAAEALGEASDAGVDGTAP